MPDEPVWEDIRHAYETTAIPVKELQTTYNITAHQLRTRREAEAWSPRSGLAAMRAYTKSQRNNVEPATGSVQAKPANKAKLKSAKAKKPTAARRQAVIARLSAAIDKKLVTLEARMERELSTLDQLDDSSAADIERDIRAIGQLIKNLEQATTHDATASTKSGITGRKRARDISITDLADEADRHRRELLDRLQRLVDTAKPTAAGDP